jgi:hypothetical protein
MPHIVTKHRKHRGFILLTQALMFGVTLAFVGLAVDAGTMYVIKGRLSSAVDAAALAAGRSLNLADTVSSATTAATATATQFFNANFTSGFLGTGTVNLTTPTFTQELDSNGLPNGILDIAVTASVPAPTYFMRIFSAFPGMSSMSSVTVSASGTASRRSTVMMLVLDVSSSMNTTPAPSACTVMIQAAQQFITNFSPFDTLGAISFDYTANLIYAPSSTFGDGSLSAAIGALTCQANTNTVSALELAYQQIQAVNLQLAYNTIVLFTDGSPNGISASFPIRNLKDTRWGPAATAPAPPAQSGTTYGQTNSCTPGGNTDANGIPDNGICVNMPVLCTSFTAITGTITQVADQNSYGGMTDGVFLPVTGDSAPVYPAGCSSATLHPTSGVDNGASLMRQMIAYIPDTDLYGNSTHGVAATNTTTISPSVCTTGKCNGLVSRDLWLFQVNAETSPDPTVIPATKNTGGLWSGFAGIGSGSNFFTAAAGNAAITGYFRPDQANSIVAATMNATMAEAYRIRSDAETTTLYHTTIDTLYLTGNGTDAVDREFLPIVANVQNIPALPYDPTYNAAANPNLYANPAYQSGQQIGQYLVTADKNQLAALFQQLASEVLRLSH